MVLPAGATLAADPESLVVGVSRLRPRSTEADRSGEAAPTPGRVGDESDAPPGIGRTAPPTVPRSPPHVPQHQFQDAETDVR